MEPLANASDRPVSLVTARDSAISIIRQEHRSLGYVVHTLQGLVRDIGLYKVEPNFKLIATILYYIAAFPERCHHPKEDEHLFKRLRHRTAKANTLLDQLQAEHVRSAALMHYLDETFVHWQGGAQGGLQQFTQAVGAYAALLWDHMECEESTVIALAREYLQEDDWEAIDEAFVANDDPLFGPRVGDEFTHLKDRIAIELPRKFKKHGSA